MNYATLSAQIQQYTQNDESSFVAQIPTFVGLAERKIYDAAQLPVTRRNVSATATSTVSSLGTPSDFNSIYELSVTSGGQVSYLINKDVSFIREIYPSSTTTGLPTYYALMDHQNILLGPTPDQNYAMEMHYFAYPASIVTSSTSWLGDRFENALLFGSLLQAYVNMKGEVDVLAAYKSAYDEALEEVKMFSQGKSRSDTYRDGQFNSPVQR